MKKIFYLFAIVTLSFFLNSCATAPKKVEVPVLSSSPSPRTNVDHTVVPGETLWRLSKMYDVSVASIVSRNRLNQSKELKMGQRLVIPEAAPIKPIISLYPTKKWKYIIIHHSATEEGNALAFHKAHMRKGWDQGVGYHFIIDNGRSGKRDGQIEISPRWLKQQDGAHYKAGDMNYKTIGICLVGNFNHDKNSTKQMPSFVHLVNTLKNYYKIPDKNIQRHGKVNGALTECPGIRFPWQGFKEKLQHAPQEVQTPAAPSGTA